MGPPIVLPSSGSKLNETLQPIWDVFSGAAKEIPPYIGTGSFVDVRNVATMHIWAFENAKKADGERYLGVQGFGPIQAAADILNDAYRGTKIGEKITKGTPGEGYVGYNKETGKVESVGFVPGARRISGKKAETEMGLKYITFQQSIVDTAKVFEALL
jgi:nucleoside-diphosphate-sugar epimerase